MLIKEATKALLLVTLILGPAAAEADSTGEPGRGSGKKNQLKNVYFGEQHLHTSASPDAYLKRKTPAS